ncbi:MAG: type II secretion system protein GspC [Nevskiales bacterium]|nr:type II secretion system protein GspC [Nevskiales bacterium]
MPETLNAQRLAALYERYVGYLSTTVNIVLTATVAWLLAQLAWALVPAPEAARWRPAPVSKSATPTSRTTLDVSSVIGRQLFGTAAAPELTETHAEEAPDTRLSLKLMGVLAGTDDAPTSRALIAASNGEEKPYAVGDEVISGVSLKAVYPDRVILERQGNFETLRLDKDAPSRANVAAVSRASADPNAASLNKIRSEILSDPTKASNYLRVQPANFNGKLRGYRLYPGREREIFKNLGLRPGDLVTAVNGVQLDDNQKALQLLGELSQATSVSLTIERGGQSQMLNLSLN